MRLSTPLLGCVLVYLCVASAAHAQLEEIVVTAERRSTDLQDTPLAISAFDQETLDRHRVVTLLDMRGLVPNLQFFENGDHDADLLSLARRRRRSNRSIRLPLGADRTTPV